MKKGLVCVLTLIMVSLLVGCAKPAATPPAAPPTPPATAPATPSAPKTTAPPATTPVTPPETVTTAKPITFRAVTAWSSGIVTVKFFEWLDKVNTASGGRVNFTYVGSTEAMPQAEQFPSLQKGIIDILYTAGPYYSNIVPDSAAFSSSRLRPEEERQSGFYELMFQIHKKYGIIYAGRMNGVVPVTYYWTNFPIKTLADFKGKKIRSTPTGDPVVVAMGAVPVNLTVANIYSSMEKRLIDGFGQPIIGSIPRGYWEVAKWIVNTPINQLPNVLLINQDSFNKVPKDIQELMLKKAQEVEATVVAFYLDVEKKDIQALKEKGVTFVDFPAAEAKWLQDKHDEVYWDGVIKGDPEFGPRLKEIAFTGKTLKRE